jgi:hypothetical protein
MAKRISVKRKKAGRPATGTEPLYGVRIADPLMKQIMDWAKTQRATRSEAMRRLVEIGLEGEKPVKATRSTPNRIRAAELAAKAIAMMVDVAAPAEEINRRRQRLTQGPPEFRQHRVDLPKAKGSPK